MGSEEDGRPQERREVETTGWTGIGSVLHACPSWGPEQLTTLSFLFLGASAHLLVSFTPVSCPAYSLDCVSDATVAG